MEQLLAQAPGSMFCLTSRKEQQTDGPAHILHQISCSFFQEFDHLLPLLCTLHMAPLWRLVRGLGVLWHRWALGEQSPSPPPDALDHTFFPRPAHLLRIMRDQRCSTVSFVSFALPGWSGHLQSLLLEPRPGGKSEAWLRRLSCTNRAELCLKRASAHFMNPTCRSSWAVHTASRVVEIFIDQAALPV